jgi:hypothetical protein
LRGTIVNHCSYAFPDDETMPSKLSVTYGKQHWLPQTTRPGGQGTHVPFEQIEVLLQV